VLLLTRLVSEVDSHVKAGVIPLGVMIAAPSPIRLEAVHIAVYLTAVLAMPRNVVINPGAVSFQPPVAVVGPVPVTESCLTDRKCDANCETSSQHEPNQIFSHKFLPKY
jgi:hypothetical protein